MSQTGASSGLYASQVYLKRVLDEMAPIKPAEASVPQILHHCLKKNPHGLFMINSTTGERITNAQILHKAISLARWLVSKGARGRNVMMVMENHQDMVATYLAFLLAGTIPFFGSSEGTTHEYQHFLKLVQPYLVVTDSRHHACLQAAIRSLQLESELLTPDDCELDDNCDDFQIPDVEPDATAVLLSTSGSTGLPKVSILTHQGLITQMPMRWCHYEKFPTPTGLVLVTRTGAGICFNKLLLSCIAYQVPILLAPTYLTVEQLKVTIITYRPTYMKLMAPTARALLPITTNEDLSSLEMVLLGGAPTPPTLKTTLKDKLRESAILDEEYGMTETHGGMILPAFTKLFKYQLRDDEGKNVGLRGCGELYIKGDILFKGYYNDELATKESFVDGWYRTGDVFYSGESGLVYKEKKKLSFKFMNLTVSPEEVEEVVSSVEGVAQCAVWLAARGPAAAVVARRPVSRELIQHTVRARLGPSKWLRGGVAFVSSLPVTSSAKLRRRDCQALLHHLDSTGQCY